MGNGWQELDSTVGNATSFSRRYPASKLTSSSLSLSFSPLVFLHKLESRDVSFDPDIQIWLILIALWSVLKIWKKVSRLSRFDIDRNEREIE